ncbi:hypothetical protein GOODEAATRI_018491, partial [Goodea atripinnis]
VLAAHRATESPLKAALSRRFVCACRRKRAGGSRMMLSENDNLGRDGKGSANESPSVLSLCLFLSAIC